MRPLLAVTLMAAAAVTVSITPTPAGACSYVCQAEFALTAPVARLVSGDPGAPAPAAEPARLVVDSYEGAVLLELGDGTRLYLQAAP